MATMIAVNLAWMVVRARVELAALMAKERVGGRHAGEALGEPSTVGAGDGAGGDAGAVGVIGDAGGGVKIIGNGSQEVSTVASSVALEPEASVATNKWQRLRRRCLAAGAWAFQVVFHHKFTLIF
jgi:hypothetical protein